MEIVTALIISGLTALFIALPFFLKTRNSAKDFEEESTVDPVLERLKALEGQKESLYSAIRDIDLDYGLGKLTQDDYDELRRKYREEAASVLKEIDGITKDAGASDLDAEIEAEIRSTRAGAQQSSEEDEIEKEISLARKNAHSGFSAAIVASCPGCGNEIHEDDLFCSKCGEKLTKVQRV